MNRSILISLGLTMFSFSALGFEAEQEALINEYNQQYEKLLIKQVTWPKVQQDSLGEVALARSEYNEAKFAIEDLTSSVVFLKGELETKRQHLAFLKRIADVSEGIKNRVKRAVVTAGYFSTVSEVNSGSLDRKASELQNEINNLSARISEKQQEISRLQNSSEYQNLIAQRNRFKTQLRNTEEAINTKSTQITNWAFSVTVLESRIRRSKDDEEELKIEAINIRTVKIPRLQNQEVTLQTNLNQDRERLTRVVSQRDQLNGEIQDLNRRIDRLKEQVANNPDNDNLKKRLANRRAERKEKREARNGLNERINRIQTRVDNNTRDLRNVRRNINDSLELALKKDREAGEEAIKQLRLGNDLEAVESSIQSARQDLITLEGDRVRLNGMVSQSQGQINNFVQVNIRPIQDQINVLDGDRSKVTGKRNQVTAWSTRLKRENENIEKAPELIADQQVVISAAVSDLSQAQQDAQAAEDSIAPLKQKLSNAIKGYNQKAQAFNSVQQKLNDLEEKMKNELSGER